MKIKTLINKTRYNDDFIVNNHHINSLSINSKTVKENDIFFAIKGQNDDGNNYIFEAIKNGAKTIIYEADFIKEFHLINYLKVDNIKAFLALCAKIFYRDITKKVTLIGVTGTNGKTTVSTVLSDYLAYRGRDVLLIGTNGIYVRDEHFHTSNTTPDILQIYDAIKYSFKKGIKTVVIEASSIGIREAKLLYFDFDIVIFTNLTHDHFDYHKNVTDYKFSKALLIWNLAHHKKKVLIMNKDDENYAFFTSLTSSNILSYSINKPSMYMPKNIIKTLYDTRFDILLNDKRYNVKTSFIGGFNVYNILSVMAAVDFLNEDLEDFVDFLKIYVSVSGRMNKIIFKNKTIIVDFAHTPSSVENVLANVKQFTNNKICVVIGCGGNRDILKRSEIGLISIKYADRVIFTSDNPREEEPEKIIMDMVGKIEENNYNVIVDRKEAILAALNYSNDDEVVVILGKGSEKEQLIKGIKHPFSDKEVVHNWIKNNIKGNQL